jgi:hypothetical protein
MIKILNISSAEDLLATLRLSNPIWNISLPGNTDWVNREVWGFRGQSDATWSLIPSAFRKSATVGFRPSSKPPALTSYDQQNQERRALNDFLFFADRLGLEVPGDGPYFRFPQFPGHPQKLDLRAWPWEAVLEALAVAQHHGVPTRLIDFTYDPLVAAFFAGYDVWEKLGRPSYKETLHEEKMIAVWAVNLPLIYSSVGAYSRANQISRVILVTAPRAKNSYLHNQEGFFLIDLHADRCGYPPLEDAILDIQKDLLTQGLLQYQAEQIIKLQLPWNCVPELLALLWLEFYNIAKMQPTLDRSAQALKDHRDLFL